MSSYLYIVKYELPIVIQSFLGAGTEWVTKYCISWHLIRPTFEAITKCQQRRDKTFTEGWLQGQDSKQCRIMVKSDKLCLVLRHIFLNDVKRRAEALEVKCYNMQNVWCVLEKGKPCLCLFVWDGQCSASSKRPFKEPFQKVQPLAHQERDALQLLRAALLNLFAQPMASSCTGWRVSADTQMLVKLRF